jgi:acyl carrier protein
VFGFVQWTGCHPVPANNLEKLINIFRVACLQRATGMPMDKQNETTPSEPLPDLAGIEQQLITGIGENLLELPSGFKAGSNLYQAGLDSMAVMHLLILIENRFGLMLSEVDLSTENLASIQSLALLIRKRLLEQAESK